MQRLIEMTDGHGPDRCIDAVGAEAHAAGAAGRALESAKEAAHLGSDRPHALEQAILACRKGGTVSVPGVYFDEVELPFGPAMNKALTMKMGQTHVQRYLEPLLQKVLDEEIDPSFVITDTVSLEDAPEAYSRFESRDDGCIKVVIRP